MEEHLFIIKNLQFNKQIDYPDLVIEKGKINFIVGESGSGKSSLLKLLNGVLSPTRGEVYYKGKNIFTYPMLLLRQEVSLVGQEVYLLEGSILENFKYFYEYRDKQFPTIEWIQRVLATCCVDNPLEQNTNTLSGGERQRVYNALFLSFLPKVLLLDEPTAALDATTSHLFLKKLIDLCKKHEITPIIVSHDPTLVQAYAEHIITLKKEGIK